MISSQIRLKLLERWLKGRAAVWGCVFRTMESTGIVGKAIHSKRHNFQPKISGAMTLWIVSSVIRPKKKPFSYTRQRSVFTEDLRFIQTKKTIESIELNSRNAVIAVIEGSNYERVSKLESRNVLVHQVRSKVLRFVINGPYKGLGEAILILLVRADTNSTTYIKKISGRYTVQKEIEKRPILYREQSGAAISISYGMAYDLFNCWQSYLEENLSVMSRGISMEQLLYKFTQENSLEGSPVLGVSGRIAVTGGQINV